jgi:hypothetical protein
MMSFTRLLTFAAASVALLAVAAGFAYAGSPAAFPPATATSGCQAQNAEPDPSCTPGAVFPEVTVAQICVPGYSRSVRDVSVETKRQVYAEYGLSYPQAPGAYEVDHLVSLELGGSNDIANLWPESAQPAPGFHQKDGLEDWLHDEVCSGALTLATAQQEIATDWLAAWQAAGMPGPTVSASNGGDSGPNTTTALPNPEPTTIPATVPTTGDSDGHTWYASTAPNAHDIYCDSDSAWQRLSPRNLVSFPSLAAAMAALPGYHLHQPC